MENSFIDDFNSQISSDIEFEKKKYSEYLKSHNIRLDHSIISETAEVCAIIESTFKAIEAGEKPIYFLPNKQDYKISSKDLCIEYSCGFLFNVDLSSVLLIEKVKPDWQKGKLNGIGGKIEKGETPIQTMNREFKEETYIEDKIDWINFVNLMVPNYNAKVYFFYAVSQYSSLFIPYSHLYTKNDFEKVCQIHYGHLSCYDRIENLDWLLPLAKSAYKTQAYKLPIGVSYK